MPYTECDEIAANMQPPPLDSYDAALAFVRAQMRDESETVISNVAWSLLDRARAGKED